MEKISKQDSNFLMAKPHVSISHEKIIGELRFLVSWTIYAANIVLFPVKPDIVILFWSIVRHPGYVVNLDVSRDNFCKDIIGVLLGKHIVGHFARK